MPAICAPWSPAAGSASRRGSAAGRSTRFGVYDSRRGSRRADHVPGHHLPQFVCFLAFWAINMLVVYRGIDTIRLLLNIKAPLLIALGLALLAWAYTGGGRFRSDALAAVAIRA